MMVSATKSLASLSGTVSFTMLASALTSRSGDSSLAPVIVAIVG
jgi:hypothetical protein